MKLFRTLSAQYAPVPPDAQVAGTSSMADMVHFTIKTLESGDHPMEVHKHSTVLELKEKIRELMGVEVDMQRLIFCGRVLQDEKRVADYKVEGKVVHMVERAPGCLHSSQRPNPPAGPNIDPSETTSSIQQQEYLFSPNHSPTMTRLLNLKTLLRTIRTSIKACKVIDPDTPDSESDSEESDEEEAYGPTARNEAHSRPEYLADLSDQLRFLEEQFEPYRERYMMCLREANDPTITLSERTLQRRQRLADKVRAVFHNLSHAHHLLSDFNLLLSHNGSRLTSEMLVENRPMSPLRERFWSAYQAMVGWYTGSVAHSPTPPRILPRRVIRVPPYEDVESEDEPVMPEPVDLPSEQEDSTSDPIPEYFAAEEFRDERSWLHVQHNGGQATCDMKVIEPFKRVISHGGFCSDGAAIIVLSACHLPDNDRPDYRYVMDNLFLYVIWSLERLVTDEYRLVYLHGSAGRRRMPSFSWLHEYYMLIERRLRKSLKELYLVHPTFWLKCFVVITKPFVSSKFFRKLNYVKNLEELLEKVPVEPNAIPDEVKHFDDLSDK
ncbi:unnamed protein product [Colias eurytheme]|nr:unnamed protein product [Colias eurytheme]